MATKLTAKAERFCRRYPVDYNPELSAVDVGYAKSGARGNAHRLLRDRRVIERIAQIEQDLLPEMGRKYLLARLYRVMHDPDTPPQVIVNAVEKAAKVQHLYEREDVAPGKVTVNINTDVPTQTEDADGSSDRHPTVEVVIPSEESK